MNKWQERLVAFNKGLDFHALEIMKPVERLYNIRKRSLPPSYDRIKLFNVPYKDAIKACAILNAREIKKREALRTNDQLEETKWYFDCVPSDASFEELSIYYNERPVTKVEGSDTQVEILKNDDYTWVD